MATAGNITAVLSLNASGFKTGLDNAKTSVEGFVSQITKSTGQVAGFNTALNGLVTTLNNATLDFNKFTEQAKGIESFNKFANGVKALSTAIKTLGTDSETTATGVARVKEIIASMEGVFGTAEVKVVGLANALKSLPNAGNQASSAFKEAQQSLMNMANGVQPLVRIREQADMMRAEFEKARATMLEFSQYGVTAFNSLDAQSDRVKAQLGAMNQEFERSKAELLEFARSGIVHFNEFEASERKATSSAKQLSSATNQASASIQRQAGANRSATASTNQLTSATSRLGKAMSSLRMMGSLVGSMLAYNFAHKLLVATGETIHAKSEMEGYFKMLNFGQGEIDHFNKALDNTVSQFQRVNKYSLGETISSIGVEFNLTTQEMEKAMKVTSMITSEYLRAGRNANEASLAVKDVLQGQFQRLSRETGVKGEQLKEAGWSGDTTDVLGLMEALEKVGESRNWDVFAEKANSLNDIITILQNRFGEWSADMVNIVQPSIVNAFNAIMMAGGAVANVLSGAWAWLNGDGLLESAVRWGAIATAITSVTTALISYRTGANLAQIVQMGLRGSIMATIFQLNAEIVAEKGVRTAIVSKITALNMEKASLMSVRSAIATKILGLNAEMVANNGLKGAIMASTFARELEEASLAGATATEKAMIVARQQEELANLSTMKTIIAHVAGVNMQTFAEKGLIVALAERIAQSPLYIGALKAEEVAELSTAEAGMLLAGTLAPLVAVFILLAGAVYSVVKPLQDASEQMKSFNNLVNNGDDIVNQHRKSLESLKKSETSLNSELGKLTKGTADYTRKEQELAQVKRDIKTANDNVTNSYKAYQKAVSAQNHFEEKSAEIRIHAQTQLQDAYIKAGISAQEASELSSQEMRDAERGAEQLRKALQMLKLEADKGAEKNSSMIDMLHQYGASENRIKEFGKNMADAQSKISEGMEKLMTSEDLMERVGGWFEIQQGRLEEWWTELNAFFEVRDWNSIRDKLFEGLRYVFTGFGAFDWISMLEESIGNKGIVGTIMDFLFGEGDSDGVLDIIWDWANSMILDPIADWLNWFIQDPFAHFDQTMDSFSLAVGKFLFGKDSDSLRDIASKWFDDNISKPIVDWINGFKNDPLSYIGNAVQTVGTPFIDGFGKLLFGDGYSSKDLFGTISSGVGESFANMLGGIAETVQNFFNDPLGTLGITLPDNWNIWSLLGLNTVSASDGSSDHPSILEDLKQGFGVDIQAFIDGMSTDPLGTLGITGAITDITTFLSQLIPISFESVTGFVQNNLIIPFGQAVYNGIMSIPLVGDILSLFGLVNGDNSGASQKGNDLATSFKTKLEEVIRNIPILGDILQLLGIIPQANPTASSNGQGVGSSIKTGFKNGLTGMAQIIQDEINHILNALGDAINQAGQKAQELGNAIVSGVRNAIDPGSPGIIAREIIGNEFGTYIPQVISNNSEMAYMSAQTYGQSVVDGISSVNFNSFGALATDYESDAQTMISTTQLLGLDTTMAFNDMALAVNTTTNTMGTNVIGTYNSMSTQQSSMLQNMKQQNMTAYNDMYQKSNQSLIQMRDSTSNLTAQMTNAWRHMKDQIVATANQLKSESTSHFNQLSNTIGEFYRKIQNPANWGANGRSPNAIPSRSSRSSSGRSIANAITSRSGGRFAGGRDVYNRSLGSSTMTIAQLKRKVCPTGTCDIFDGYSATTRVNPAEFLGMFADDYFFGWNDWNSTHYNYIKNKSDEWEMKSPQIQLMGGIDTDAKYKVGDFENGSPQISFESFQSMAESIFSVIPYRLYYNSDWKGSWLGALQAGACNCWDGAHALLALANTCGFSGSIGSGSWGSYGHVWAIINGKIMDTTAWQGGYGWTSPKVSGYGNPNISARRATHNLSENNQSESVKVEVTINGNIYGVDDLDSHISESIDKGLEKHFNKAYTIGV